jgi:hypothetical protein
MLHRPHDRVAVVIKASAAKIAADDPHFRITNSGWR